MRQTTPQPAHRNPQKRVYAHALGVLALLALAAVGASGCAGMKVAPASVLIEPAGGGNGKAVIVSTGAGEVTKGSANFEITNQAITGAQAAFFEFVGAKTCAGTKWPKVVPFEIKVCNIEVNAKAGSYTSGVTATLETTYKVNAGSAVVLKTPLAQK